MQRHHHRRPRTAYCARARVDAAARPDGSRPGIATAAPAAPDRSTPEAPSAPGRRTPGQLRGAAILSSTVLAASAGNYVLNIATARFLEPAEFGDANLAVNLVLVSAAVAATLQLAAARVVAAGTGSPARLARWALALGAAFAVTLAGGSRWLADVLSTSTPWMFVVVGAGLPVYFAQAVARGSLQGRMRLGRLAASYAAEAATRLAVSFALLAAGAGVVGVAVGITASFVASALVTLRRRPSVEGGEAPAAELRSVTATASVLLVGQVVIANGDVVLAKWLLAPDVAGAYAGAALVGRSLFFLSWPVVHSTFPVVAAATSAAARRAATRRATALVTVACSAGVGALAVAGPRTAPLLLGESSAGAVGLLVPYAIATTAFAVANLLAGIGLAAGRRAAPLALAAGAVLQTALLLGAGDDPADLVRAQIIAMAVTLVAVGIAHAVAERRSSSAERGALVAGAMA